MAEWINLFDLGECTVMVTSDDSGSLLSQVMAKGDSATFSDNKADPLDFTVAISASGEVSISGASYNNQSLLVLIAPSYSHDLPSRISGAVFDPITASAAGFTSDEGAPDEIAYTSLIPAAPEPLVLTDLGDFRAGVGLKATPSI